MSIYRILVAKNGSQKILIDIPCRSFPDSSVSHIANDILKQLSSTYNIPTKMSILFSLLDHKDNSPEGVPNECALIFDTVGEMDAYSRHFQEHQKQAGASSSLVFSPVARMSLSPPPHHGFDGKHKHPHISVENDEYKQPLLYQPRSNGYDVPYDDHYDEKTSDAYSQQHRPMESNLHGNNTGNDTIDQSLFHQLQKRLDSAKQEVLDHEQSSSMSIAKPRIKEQIQFDALQQHSDSRPTSFQEPLSGVMVSSILSQDNQRFTRVVSSTGLESYTVSGDIPSDNDDDDGGQLQTHTEHSSPFLNPHLLPTPLSQSPSTSSADLRRSGKSRDYTTSQMRLPPLRGENSPLSPEQFTEHVSNLSLQLSQQRKQHQQEKPGHRYYRRQYPSFTGNTTYTPAPKLEQMRLQTSTSQQQSLGGVETDTQQGQSPTVHYQKHFAKYAFHYFLSHNLFYVCITSANVNQDGIFTMLDEMKHSLQQDLGYILYHITNSHDIRLKRPREGLSNILHVYGQQFNWRVSNFHHTHPPSYRDGALSAPVYRSQHTVSLKSLLDLNNLQQLLYSKQMCGNITPTPFPSAHQYQGSTPQGGANTTSIQDRLAQAFLHKEGDAGYDPFGDGVWRSPPDIGAQSHGEYMLLDSPNIIESQQRRWCRPLKTWHVVLILVLALVILGLGYLAGAFACGGFLWPKCI